MVIGHCTYSLKKGSREDFIREVTECGFIENARKEPGNIFYVPYLSAEDPDIVMITEGWKSPADIKAHEQMPHLADLNAVLVKYLISLKLEYFETDGYLDKRVLRVEDL